MIDSDSDSWLVATTPGDSDSDSATLVTIMFAKELARHQYANNSYDSFSVDNRHVGCSLSGQAEPVRVSAALAGDGKERGSNFTR